MRASRMAAYFGVNGTPAPNTNAAGGAAAAPGAAGAAPGPPCLAGAAEAGGRPGVHIPDQSGMALIESQVAPRRAGFAVAAWAALGAAAAVGAG